MYMHTQTTAMLFPPAAPDRLMFAGVPESGSQNNTL